MATRAEANLKMMRSVENVERELIRLETIRREPKGEFLTDVHEFQTAINEVTAEAIVLNETIRAVEAAEAPSGLADLLRGTGPWQWGRLQKVFFFARGILYLPGGSPTQKGPLGAWRVEEATGAVRVTLCGRTYTLRFGDASRS